ncbi:hypothetical protein [Paenibacillus sp. P36]|uniref:hypothetical protein n=1 Tax=Paenibacillus sp. P36 TaxID=3342538 RepID=UPI0038B3BFC8
MNNWEWNLDLVVRVATVGVTLLGAIAAGIGATIAIRKYLYEKNREIYIRRLDEVYAPLFGLIVKQRMYSELYPEREIPHNRLITLVAAHARKGAIHTRLYADPEKRTLTDRELKKLEDMEYGLDAEDFITIFRNANKGLMRPKLLELFNQYEILSFAINVKESYNANSTEAEKGLDSSRKKQAAFKREDVEEKIIEEITEGYHQTIGMLKLK